METMFPAEFVNPEWNACWGAIHTERLGWLGEQPLLTNAPDVECFRLFDDGIPKVLRITATATNVHLVAKHEADSKEMTEDGLFRREVRQSQQILEANKLTRLRELVRRAEFWSLPSCLPPQGLDGRHYVFEAYVGGSYHLVDRWCPPDRSGFGRLCNYGWLLFNAAFGVRRPWWQFWKR